MTNKKLLVSDITSLIDEDLTKNKSPFNISVRPTLAGLLMNSFISSASKVQIKNNNIYVDLTPLSVGVCSETIYKKLKPIKHASPIDIKMGDNNFM